MFLDPERRSLINCCSSICLEKPRFASCCTPSKANEMSRLMPVKVNVCLPRFISAYYSIIIRKIVDMIRDILRRKKKALTLNKSLRGIGKMSEAPMKDVTASAICCLRSAIVYEFNQRPISLSAIWPNWSK